MAEYKFTIQRGKTGLADVAVAAGSAEAQSDTLSVNIDTTNLAKGEVQLLLHAVLQKIEAGPWPPL